MRDMYGNFVRLSRRIYGTRPRDLSRWRSVRGRRCGRGHVANLKCVQPPPSFDSGPGWRIRLGSSAASASLPAARARQHRSEPPGCQPPRRRRAATANAWFPPPSERFRYRVRRMPEGWQRARTASCGARRASRWPDRPGESPAARFDAAIAQRAQASRGRTNRCTPSRLAPSTPLLPHHLNSTYTGTEF